MGFELLRSGKTTSGCGYIHIYPYPSGGYGYGYTTPKILWIWILKGLKIHNHIHWRALRTSRGGRAVFMVVEKAARLGQSMIAKVNVQPESGHDTHDVLESL